MLGPVPERRHLRRGDQRHLVAPLHRQPSHHRAQPNAWVLLDGDRVGAGILHLDRSLEQLHDVDAHERAWHQPEVGQRRVAAADVRWVGEYPAEAVVLRQRLERRARIGDGRELLAVPLCLLVEVREVRERLGRLARLGGDDEKRCRELDLRAHTEDRRGIGRVEDVQLRVSFDGAERVAQHVGTQARSTHAEQDHVGELATLHGEVAQLAPLLEHLVRDVEPAQPVADLLPLGRISAPEGRVLGPQAPRRIVLLQPGQLRVHRRLEPAQAVPLARTLSGLDFLRALLEGREQALE